jgi:divalent metal cation (Fe/Co/Zn/Cd) transporter
LNNNDLQKNKEKIVTRVSWVGIWGNAVLTAFKLFAGIVAHSGAMVSDAVHSASDVFSTLIVLISVKFAGKEGDA